MMETYEEAQVIAALGRPDTRRQAFGQTVRHYSPQIYRQIRRMVLSHDDTNDVLQNTFIKAWTNLDSFRGEARISTWLYRIALNETLNFLQQKRQNLSVEAEEAGSIVHTLQADPYFDGDATELQLQQAMAELPDKQRLVFQLKYYEEMKYEEMSRVLDTSVGALKASYHHAVKKISRFIEALD